MYKRVLFFIGLALILLALSGALLLTTRSLPRETLVSSINGEVLILPTPTPTYTSTPTPTSTYTPAPTATPFTIDTMDSTLNWMPYDDGESSIMLHSVRGISGNAVQISFDLREDGWVGLSKVVNPELSSVLPGIERIRFFYKGSGAPNTIELKLLYRPDSRGKSAVFSVLWYGVTVTEGWSSLEPPVSAFFCWADTGCQFDEEIDLERVWKIDFAISNEEGDSPGVGIVAIDDIRGIR